MDITRLNSGREMIIRPLRRDDGARLAAAYERLSDEMKYRRFLAPKPHLSTADVRYLVNVNDSDHLALVAAPVEAPDRIVAVARLVRLPEDPQTAELAVVVGDAFQRDGLGHELVARLAAMAVERGVQRLQATMLSDNSAAHHLVAGLGARELRRTRSDAIDQIEYGLAA